MICKQLEELRNKLNDAKTKGSWLIISWRMPRMILVKKRAGRMCQQEIQSGT